MAIIYHLTKKETWEQAKEQDGYDFCALKTQGVIHCSTSEQTIPTANRFFKEQSDVIVLEIDEDKIKAKLIYERAEDIGEDFPHIYGVLNIDAVISTKSLEKNEEGHFIGLKDQVYI